MKNPRFRGRLGSKNLQKARGLRAFQVDPASYEHFIETLRQGSAGLLRVGAAARLLQREAHKTSAFAKAVKG